MAPRKTSALGLAAGMSLGAMHAGITLWHRWPILMAAGAPAARRARAHKRGEREARGGAARRRRAQSHGEREARRGGAGHDRGPSRGDADRFCSDDRTTAAKTHSRRI